MITIVNGKAYFVKDVIDAHRLGCAEEFSRFHEKQNPEPKLKGNRNDIRKTKN